MTSDPNPQASIAEQAAHWWIVLNSEDASATEQREFSEWMTQGPDRIAAYLRTALLMKAARSASIKWPNTPADVLVREAKAAQTRGLARLRELPAPAESNTRRSKNKTNWSRLAMATATSLLVALGAAWFVLTSPQEFHTRFGEQRSILLEDGTRIALNTESTIKVELRKDHRLVALESGEALFQVAHDTNRPFDVSVGSVVVRAVGTEFNIKRAPDRTTIAVVEGRIAVAPASQVHGGDEHSDFTSSGAVFLGAADRLVVDRSGAGSPEHGINLRGILAWTEHKLVFDHTSLSEAAGEFNRYNRPRIQITGSSLQDRRISGVFKSDDPASFLTFLSRIPGVRIHEAADGTHIVE
jgi:transmembrane sensor